MVTGGSFKPAARGTWPAPEVLGQSLPPAGFVSFLSSGGEEDSALLQNKGKIKAKLPLLSRRTLQGCQLKGKPWVCSCWVCQHPMKRTRTQHKTSLTHKTHSPPSQTSSQWQITSYWGFYQPGSKPPLATEQAPGP